MKTRIEISLKDQQLVLHLGQDKKEVYPVSTALNGPGEKDGSECTPRGRHIICEMFGADCQPGTVFVARKPTGEIFNSELEQACPGRDWILTRILRLAGTEPGFNKGGNSDSWERMIYIHGSPDHLVSSAPGSHGCIRMRNADVMHLFDQVETGTPVDIHE